MARASRRRAPPPSSASPALHSGGGARLPCLAHHQRSHRADAVSRSHLTSCCDPVVGGNRFTELAPIVSASLNGQPNFVTDGSNLRLLLAPSSCLTVRIGKPFGTTSRSPFPFKYTSNIARSKPKG